MKKFARSAAKSFRRQLGILRSALSAAKPREKIRLRGEKMKSSRLFQVDSTKLRSMFLAGNKTIREVAKEIGMSRARFAKYLNDDMPINSQNAQRLVAYFGEDAVKKAEKSASNSTEMLGLDSKTV